VSHLLSHHGDTVAAFHILRWVLASSQEQCGDNVGGMRIEPPNTSSHCTTDQVLAGVELDQGVDVALENTSNDVSWNDCLCHRSN